MRAEQLILLGIFLFVAFFLVANFGGFFVIAGNPDSDLITQNQALSNGTLIGASPIYMTGQNQPLQGNVVLMNFAVGTGNDIAAVGTTDGETMSVNGEGKTVNYKVYVRKNAMNTFIAFSGNRQTLRNITDIGAISGTQNSYSLGTAIQSDFERQNAVLDAAQKGYSYCRNTLGSTFAGYGWRPATDTETRVGVSPVSCSSGICARCDDLGGATGFCASGWRVVSYFKCYKFGDTAFEYQDFGAKTINASIDVQIESTTNGASQTVTLQTNNSQLAPEAYIYAGGQAIGYAKINYFGTSAELPLDLTTEVPVTGSGTSYSWRLGKVTYADSAWATINDLQNSGVGSYWGGNWSAIEGKISSYNSYFNSFRNNLKTKFNDKYSFSQSGNGFLINDAFTQMANLQVIVKGNWIGLIRDIADFDLFCGNNVFGQEQETKYSSITVRNTSSVSGAGSLSWGCPASNGTRSISLGAGQSQTISDIPFRTSSPGTGDCQFLLSYGTNQKNCSISYTFVPKPQTCGNGVADSTENCANCPTDVHCALGMNCNLQTGNCETPPPTCGNGKIDAGENCANCPQDYSCGAGNSCQFDGTCKTVPQTDNLVFWAIVAALIIVAIILGYFLVVKK